MRSSIRSIWANSVSTGSSRRLEREASRNVEVMWLLGRLVPDHKTVADFRKDNGRAIRKVCARFVELCREMGLLAKASVALDARGTDRVVDADQRGPGLAPLARGNAADRSGARRDRHPRDEAQHYGGAAIGEPQRADAGA